MFVWIVICDAVWHWKVFVPWDLGLSEGMVPPALRIGIGSGRNLSHEKRTPPEKKAPGKRNSTLLHPVSVRRFPSFRSQPLEHLSRYQ